MVFAPAMGIACLQALSWLCLLVAALALAAVIRQAVAPSGNIELGQMLAVAAVFGAGGFGCRWGAAALRRVAGGR
jgi:hypothetical protein